MSTGKSIHDLIELRGVDDPAEAGLEDIWIAGEPVGILLSSIDARQKEADSTVEDLQVDVEQLRSDVGTAITLANQATEDEVDMTKKRVALLNTRDQLVKDALLDTTGKGAKITIDEVVQMAKPEVQLYHQTVIDAWDELRSSWYCFEKIEQDGKTKLRITREEITPELVKAVKHDLEREDLAKRLHSKSSEEGG
jgi:outer membrane murein-binding lipoprotein Lpp